MEKENDETENKIIRKCKLINLCISLQIKTINDFNIGGIKIPYFDLEKVYKNWNHFLGYKIKSFDRFLHIYYNNIFIYIAFKNANISLNNCEVEKWNSKKRSDINQRINLMFKAEDAVYHSRNLTIYIRASYDKFIGCLLELFQVKKSKKFGKNKRNILEKMKKAKIDSKLIEFINNIATEKDLKKIDDCRTEIVHQYEQSFSEFIPISEQKKKLKPHISFLTDELLKLNNIISNFIFLTTMKKYEDLKLEKLPKVEEFKNILK